MNAPLLDQSSPEQVYSSKQCGKIWITDSACDTNNNQTSLFCAIKHRCTLDVPLTKLVVIFSTISNITDPECTDESPQALLAAIYSDTAGNQLLNHKWKYCGCLHCLRCFFFAEELEEEEVVVHDVPASSYLEESSLDDTTQSSSHDTSHTTVPERATPRRKKTTKSKNRWEEELSQVDKAIAAQSDQASLYGQMLASKLRSCPKRMKQVMELDLLDFFKRYTFEEEPE